MDFKNIFKTSFLVTAFIGVSSFFIFVVLFLFSDINNQNLSLASVSDSFKIVSKPERNWDVAEVVVNAKSAIVVEYNSSRPDKTLLSQNNKVRLPIASLTKLVSATIVLDNYDLYRSATVSKIADAQSPVLQDVVLNDTLPIENLLEIMLVASSNKSAYTLSEVMGTEKFVALMNQKASEIGMENTFFEDPTGLSAKNESTASDLVKLIEHILEHYPKISEITKQTEIYIPGKGRIENTNQLISQVSGALLSKTGFTKEANGCMVLVVNNEQGEGYLIYIVLGADDRFLTMQDIINWVQSAYTW